MSIYTLEELDVRYLLCPMPVIRLQECAKGQSEGQSILLRATDPGVKQDVPAWCRVHGHRVESVTEENGEIQVTIQLTADG